MRDLTRERREKKKRKNKKNNNIWYTWYTSIGKSVCILPNEFCWPLRDLMLGYF